MGKAKKAIAVIIVVLLLMVEFCSLEFVAEHEHHHCKGEDCPICAQLEIAISMLRNMGTALGLAVAISFLYLSAKVYAVSYETVCVKNTLVRLKQEMLN